MSIRPDRDGNITVGYGDNSGTIQYTPPRDTCDKRFEECADHHPACDCREAEISEYVHESIADRRFAHDTFARVLRGHQTWGRGDDPGCMCTGCQIAREAHILHIWEPQ